MAERLTTLLQSLSELSKNDAAKKDAFRAQSLAEIYDRVNRLDLARYENDLNQYGSKKHDISIEFDKDDFEGWEGNMNIRHTALGLDTENVKTPEEVFKEILVSTIEAKKIRAQIRTSRACTGICDQLLYYSFEPSKCEKKVDIPKEMTAAQLEQEKRWREDIAKRHLQKSTSHAPSIEECKQRVCHFQSIEADFKIGLAVEMLPCKLLWEDDTSIFRKSDRRCLNYTNIRDINDHGYDNTMVKTPAQLVCDMFGRLENPNRRLPEILYLHLYTNQVLTGEMDQVLYFSPHDGSTNKRGRSDEHETLFTNKFNKPVDEEVKTKRLHIANMTIAVYGLDVNLLQQQLAIEMQERGKTICWTKSGRFHANTNLRVERLGQLDDLSLKSVRELCDEICKAGANAYYALLSTADEITGRNDQMIYYRW